MESKHKLIVDSFGRDRFKFDEPLKEHTSLEVGGPAKLFFIAFTIEELIKIIEATRQLKLQFFLFGTGSKMMISDQGFDGLVVKNRTKNIRTISIKGKVSKVGIGVEEALVEVDSGVSISKLCEYLDANGLTSLQISGISGTVGGNLFINKILQTHVKSIKVLDLDSNIEEIEASKLRGRMHIILSAIFRIKAK